MQQLISVLFQHELCALKDALQRDECRELQRVASNPEWAEWHRQNARLSRRLIDLIDSCADAGFVPPA